jgi:hypothetical protein
MKRKRALPLLIPDTTTEDDLQQRLEKFSELVDAVFKRKCNTNPPQGVTLPYEIQRGIQLQSEIAEQFRRAFDAALPMAAPTFTGSGFHSDPHLGDLGYFTRMLLRISRDIDRLTQLANIFRERDILRDFEDLKPVFDIEYQHYVDDKRVSAFSEIWRRWCIGYRFPGRLISGSSDDADRFSPWRYCPWTKYFSRALIFYSSEKGRPVSDSRAKQVFQESWTEIHKRMSITYENKVPTPFADLFLRKPVPRRRTTIKRTPENEQDLERYGLLHVQTSKEWQCNRCEQSLTSSRVTLQQSSKFDSYICPSWHDCGGVLHPIFATN